MSKWTKYNEETAPEDLFSPSAYQFRTIIDKNISSTRIVNSTKEGTEFKYNIKHHLPEEAYIQYRRNPGYRENDKRQRRREDIDKLLATSAEVQKEKMLTNKNMSKDTWKLLTLEELSSALFEEVRELADETVKEFPDMGRVQDEASDVANFAAMIIEHCKTILDKNKEK